MGTFKRVFYTWLIIVWITANSCGTLGGFGNITFPVKKSELVTAIDTLYAEFPKYNIPAKWTEFNDWNRRGYDFLDARIFYFDSNPEEMYYVSFVGDTPNRNDVKETQISIRAVFRKNTGWQLENNLRREEKKQIEKRFHDEIVIKLEKYTISESY